jgi:hypothetical protein
MIAAVLPASGKAERFGGIPKFLLPVDDDGISLLDYQIRGLSGLVDHVVVTTQMGYLELVESRRQFWPKSLSVRVIANEPSTMPQAFLKGASEFPYADYLCLFPDTFYQALHGPATHPLAGLVSSAHANPSVLALGLWEISPDQYGSLGQVDLDETTGEVLQVHDKDSECKLPLAWGAFYIPNKLIPNVLAGDLHMGVAFHRVIDDGRSVIGIKVRGRYWDLANFHQYRTLLSDLHYSGLLQGGSANP